ncbi:MAG: Ig-like domain repeat protein [Planctomycetota bacterium]|nr:Ig-like domain repeat protein [Planctomycetota bacterium]
MARRSRIWVEQLEDRRLLAAEVGTLGAGEVALPELEAMTAVPQSLMTATTLEVSATLTTYGMPVTLLAVVSNSAGVGAVKFMDGQAEITQAFLNAQGEATLTVSDLAVGTHNITAEYGGATGWLSPSASTPVAVTVRRGATKTVLQASSKSTPQGQEVTFTAWVSGAVNGRSDAAGTVAFKEGRTILGYGVIGGGMAAFTASAMNEGKHSIMATFGSDGHYTGSRSAAVTETITHATVVDLLALYTPTAVSEAGGDQSAHEAVVEAVRDTNRALANSRVPLSIRLVYDGQTRYRESGMLETDLDRLAGANDGYMDEAPGLRNRYGADLVTLFAGTGDVGGMAYTLQYPQAWHNDELGFSVILIQQAAAPTYTLAHELGHNFGAVHDPANADDPGAYPYSYGYRFWARGEQYRDIMAYDPGEIIPYFANPNVKYKGVPTGTSSSADVARTIRQTAGIVAQYRKQVTVGTVSTVMELAGPGAVSNRGQTVSFTATVSARKPADGLVGGRVVFYDGNRVVASVLLAGGKATWSSSGLKAGKHSITAVYAGDGNFGGSRSGVVRQSVVYGA